VCVCVPCVCVCVIIVQQPDELIVCVCVCVCVWHTHTHLSWHAAEQVDRQVYGTPTYINAGILTDSCIRLYTIPCSNSQFRNASSGTIDKKQCPHRTICLPSPFWRMSAARLDCKGLSLHMGADDLRFRIRLGNLGSHLAAHKIAPAATFPPRLQRRRSDVAAGPST